MPTGTYHGIIRAACLTCRYRTIDDTTLEVWNDAPMVGACPNCHTENGQTLWVTLDGRVTVVSFVNDELVAQTDVTGDAAFRFRTVALSERVAALIPGASSQDDGGGEYVDLSMVPQARTDNDEGVMVFVCSPENAGDPAMANRWVFQHNGTPQTVETSDLTIDADPADVAAWTRQMLGQPAEPEVRSKVHTMSAWNVLRLAEMVTEADATGRGIRVAWDGGLKVKVGEGMWSPPLSAPEQPVDFDTAEAAGLDGTGRDGDARFPYTAGDLT